MPRLLHIMPKQYGSNGVNSDGSLMNQGNQIWDPQRGGRPSIRLFPTRNAMARSRPPWLPDTEEKDKGAAHSSSGA